MLTEEEYKEKLWVCDRKKVYKRYEWAEESLTQGINCGHYSSNYHIYECPFCFSYHIGRKPRNVDLSEQVRLEETSGTS